MSACPDIHNSCLVCSASTSQFHFGARVCRACAAFFRRSVATQKTYKCLRGRTCQISTKVRCVCRACRYQKCLAVGMIEDEVRARLKEGSSSPAINFVHLPRICDAYEKLQAKRMARFGSDCGKRRLNFAETDERFFVDVTYVREFLFDSFDEISRLLPDQENLLFESFFLQFHQLEMGYSTAMSGQDDVAVLPTGDYFDIRERETFLINGDGSHNERADDFMKLAALVCPSLIRNINNPLRSLNLTTTEFLCLGMIQFWSSGVDGTTEETEQLVVQVRDDLMAEIVEQMKLNGVEEPGKRLSEMLLCTAQVQRAVRRLQSTYELCKITDSYRIHEGLHSFMSAQF